MSAGGASPASAAGRLGAAGGCGELAESAAAGRTPAGWSCPWGHCQCAAGCWTCSAGPSGHSWRRCSESSWTSWPGRWSSLTSSPVCGYQCWRKNTQERGVYSWSPCTASLASSPLHEELLMLRSTHIFCLIISKSFLARNRADSLKETSSYLEWGLKASLTSSGLTNCTTSPIPLKSRIVLLCSQTLSLPESERTSLETGTQYTGTGLV